MLYCSIPKVASTMIKGIFAKMTGFTGELHHNSVHNETYLESIGLHYLSRYSAESIQDKLKHYFKFMVVRHPFERIISAYRDKFQTRNPFTQHFQQKYGRKIIREFRHNATDESLRYGNDVRFEEFIQYIISMSKHGTRLNPHWRPYTEICFPCLIHYDYIGKLNSLQWDMKYILTKFDNDGCPLYFPELVKHSSTTEGVMEFFKQSVGNMYDQIAETYKNDMLLFGYQ